MLNIFNCHDCNVFSEYVQDVCVAVKICLKSCSNPEGEFAEFTGIEPSTLVKKSTKRGIFATSFEAIPCDLTIQPLQFRTGHRYISPDTFPGDEDFYDYLTLQKETSLKSHCSNSSFCLATSEDLSCQLMCRKLAEDFQSLNEKQTDILHKKYPLQMEYLQEQEINSELLEKYFTFPDGRWDKESLETMSAFLGSVLFKGQHSFDDDAPLDEGLETRLIYKQSSDFELQWDMMTISTEIVSIV